jgi:hypothetical protein
MRGATGIDHHGLEVAGRTAVALDERRHADRVRWPEERAVLPPTRRLVEEHVAHPAETRSVRNLVGS